MRGVDSSASFSPFIKELLEVAVNITGEMIEVCKRSGDFSVSNVSLSKVSMVAIWPSGDYRISLKLFDDIDDNISNGSYYGTLFNGSK